MSSLWAAVAILSVGHAVLLLWLSWSERAAGQALSEARACAQQCEALTKIVQRQGVAIRHLLGHQAPRVPRVLWDEEDA